MKHLVLLCLISLPFALYSQNILPVQVVGQSNEIVVNLNNSAYFIKDKEKNHIAVDMVSVYTVDSTFNRKFERHRVVGGGVIRVLGFRWKSVDKTRKKFVGWVNKHYLHGIDDKAHFTEYDINYDLIPALDKYKDLACHAYQAQMGMKKAKKKKQSGQEPYVYPSDSADLTKYRFHCEITPAVNFRSQLNTMFYPVHRNNDLHKHPNFLNPHPVMGMYGVYVLDCNHGCHPEIHPYEWIWWLNLTEEKTSWNIGLMRDVSNRFKHWSSAPRTGEISIPFSFPLDAENWEIHIDHLMFGNFSEEGFQELNLNGNYYDFSVLQRKFQLETPQLEGKSLTISSSVEIPYKSIQYAIQDLQYHTDSRTLSGIFHLAMSVNEVYTAEVFTNYTPVAQHTDFEELLDLMHGSFSSKEQAAKDSSYRDISLHMYPIWEDKAEGWMYVEQALSSMPAKPYRQRIYHVQQIDAASFKSDIYLLPNDSVAIGNWKNPAFFNQWSPEDLTLKEGCTVYLKKQGEKFFKGQTIEGACLSDFNGASYATSIVEIKDGEMQSWDRGFDDEGAYVWGAEKGPYLFKK